MSMKLHWDSLETHTQALGGGEAKLLPAGGLAFAGASSHPDSPVAEDHQILQFTHLDRKHRDLGH